MSPNHKNLMFVLMPKKTSFLLLNIASSVTACIVCFEIKYSALKSSCVHIPWGVHMYATAYTLCSVQGLARWMVTQVITHSYICQHTTFCTRHECIWTCVTIYLARHCTRHNVYAEACMCRPQGNVYALASNLLDWNILDPLFDFTTNIVYTVRLGQTKLFQAENFGS